MDACTASIIRYITDVISCLRCACAWAWGGSRYGDALAIAQLATQLGNGTLAATFTQRAGWVRQEYLKLLWNEEIQFLAVYKENLQNNSK